MQFLHIGKYLFVFESNYFGIYFDEIALQVLFIQYLFQNYYITFTISQKYICKIFKLELLLRTILLLFEHLALVSGCYNVICHVVIGFKSHLFYLGIQRLYLVEFRKYVHLYLLYLEVFGGLIVLALLPLTLSHIIEGWRNLCKSLFW